MLCFLESWKWCSCDSLEAHISSSILPLLRLHNTTWSVLKFSDSVFRQLSTIFNNFSKIFNLSSYFWFSTIFFQFISQLWKFYFILYFQFLVFFTWKTSFSHFFLSLPHGSLWFLIDLRRFTLQSLPIKNMPFHWKFLPPDTCQAFLNSYTYRFIEN